MQSEPYIKIPNYIYEPIIIDDTDTGTLFHRIGTGGFTVLSFLQILQENKPSSKVRITDIRNELGVKKNETALRYFNSLLKEQLIIVENKKYGDKIKALEMLTYTISSEYLNAQQFEPISSELFTKKIKLLGINGWTILCYLTKLHNYSLGDINTSMGTQGYASPTFELLSHKLSIGSKSTINNILELLETLKLISIIKSDVVISYVDALGIQRFKRANNKYVVHSKIPNRKYFLPINLSVYKQAMKIKNEKT